MLNDELKGQIQTALPHFLENKSLSALRPAVIDCPRWPSSLAACKLATKNAAMANPPWGRCGSRDRHRQDCSLLPGGYPYRQASGQPLVISTPTVALWQGARSVLRICRISRAMRP